MINTLFKSVYLYIVFDLMYNINVYIKMKILYFKSVIIYTYIQNISMY